MDKGNTCRLKKRRKKVFTCPNPLFEKWLREWKDEAAENGWKSRYIYAKALNSLRKYPLPLKNGKEAKLLENFGDKICKMLDEKLKEYNLQQVSSSLHIDDNKVDSDSEKVEQNSSYSNTEVPNVLLEKVKRKRNLQNQNKKQYIPTSRSGSYAILMSLYQLESENQQFCVRKSHLQDTAQPFCDSSFHAPPPGSRYTAWSSMRTLITKGLVKKEGTPAWYSLTESGRNLAILLLESENNNDKNKNYEIYNPSHIAEFVSSLEPNEQSVPKPLPIKETFQTTRNTPILVEECDTIVCDDPLPSLSQSTEDLLPSLSSNTTRNEDATKKFGSGFVLNPGTFDIILCVDNCETTAWSTKKWQKEVLAEIKNNAVPCDIRKLNVGDFIWVAREKVQPVSGVLHALAARELVLDYVVERKRMDDLAHSIKDGRFHEQKFRLKNSGLKHQIYLVEEFGKGQQFGLPESSLEQAIVNTQVVDGFTVKRTKGHKESVAYLTIMTRYLQQMFMHQRLTSGIKEVVQDPTCSSDVLMTFQEFNFTSLKNKRLTVKEMFAKQLLQLHGLSVDKAAAIVEKYPMPSSLIDGYSLCSTEEEKEKLLALLKYGASQRNVGPSLSRSLYQLYCTNGPC